jgi:hypothetical protein
VLNTDGTEDKLLGHSLSPSSFQNKTIAPKGIEPQQTLLFDFVEYDPERGPRNTAPGVRALSSLQSFPHDTATIIVNNPCQIFRKLVDRSKSHVTSSHYLIYIA